MNIFLIGEPSSSSRSDRYQPPANFDELLQNHRMSNSQASSRASRDEPPSKQLRETLHKYGVDMKEPKLPQSRRYGNLMMVQHSVFLVDDLQQGM
jgi:hypothetical protein